MFIDRIKEKVTASFAADNRILSRTGKSGGAGEDIGQATSNRSVIIEQGDKP